MKYNLPFKLRNMNVESREHDENKTMNEHSMIEISDRKNNQNILYAIERKGKRMEVSIRGTQGSTRTSTVEAIKKG